MTKGLRDVLRRHAKRTTDYNSIVLFSLGVFLAGFSASSLFAQTITQQNIKDYDTKLQEQASLIDLRTEDRMQKNGQLLYTAATLFNINGDISREEWRQFYEDMRVNGLFPNLQALGYMPVIKHNDLAAFKEQIANEGLGDQQPYPTGERAEYTPITYVEPFNDINKKAFMYDMYTSDTRRIAMETARDSANVVMSAPARLVQDADNPKAHLGVLLFYPVYRGKGIPATVAERRQSLDGYVYLTVRPGDFIDTYIAQSAVFDNENVDVRLIDIALANKPLFNGQKGANAPDSVTRSTEKRVSIYGRSWSFTISGHDKPISRLYGPLGIFLMGGLISAILGGVTYYMLFTRLKNVRKAYDKGVQKTKDELLALASHQLRTPASGVKQYLGMLKTGILGPLSIQQMAVAEKAYNANERQLQIINELLYVSKIDAGQLLIEPVETDISSIVRRAVESFQTQAANKKIVLKASAGKGVMAKADDRYISMVVENLISNAIKYSYPDTTVCVTLRKTKDTVNILVKDSGVGVDKQHYDQIFGKFDRVENPLSHVEGGSGLGLFLARQLARAHGGDITVTSAVGTGSTFILSLPRHSRINKAVVSLRHNKKEP